jgi:hypothetical protein
MQTYLLIFFYVAALLSHQQPNRLTAPVLPNAKIVFSIVNSRQFTARAEIGTVSPALLQTFKMIPEAKFDWQTCKWLFPLSAHDNLHVSLAIQIVFVYDLFLFL